MLDRVASTMLFGLAANTDNLTIGVAYGLKHRWIGWRQNLVIAAATTLLTLLALALGRQIREMLPAKMPDILGGVLLLTFATWNIYRERTGASGRPPVLTSRFAERVSVGIGGAGYICAALSIFCFSVAMLALGQAVGNNFIRVKLVPQMLRYPMSGNAVLALAGVLMLVGY